MKANQPEISPLRPPQTAARQRHLSCHVAKKFQAGNISAAPANSPVVKAEIASTFLAIEGSMSTMERRNNFSVEN
jgi:hypothetical protein